MNSADLVFVCDGTSSMLPFLTSMRSSIRQICQMARLSGLLRRIGVLLYTDYTNVRLYPNVTTWSGWQECSTIDFSIVDRLLEEASANLVPGGDEAEACKTALSFLLSLDTDSKNQTIVIWYGDAAPHHSSNREDPPHPNYDREKQAIPVFDWLELCEQARTKNLLCYPIIPSADPLILSFFALLSHTTAGTCFSIAPVVSTAVAIVSNVAVSAAASTTLDIPYQEITNQTLVVLLSLLNIPVAAVAPAATTLMTHSFRSPLPKSSPKFTQTEETLKTFLPMMSASKRKTILVPPTQLKSAPLATIAPLISREGASARWM
ncbi:hypothetical protein HDU91_007219, partial [Kappamyces sp. JEL0680]